MELKELLEKTLSLFNTSSVDELGGKLKAACSDYEKLFAFRDMVSGDLVTDWLQMIYQYYQADRKEKKQDYTPKSIACFMGMLAGSSNHIIDLCAGSGALIIQKWGQNPDTRFTAVEIDRNVLPYLLFNMVLRNIHCRVYRMDALGDSREFEEAYDITKGEEFGIITDIKPAI